MRACWRRLSPPCMCALVYLGVCVCDVSQSLSDTFGERKCEWTRQGSVKFPPRASSFAPGDSEAKFWGQTERNWGLSSERTQAQQPSQSLLPAVLCIIIHSSRQPQTPSSHHLSCCCHSDFQSDLSLSCPPVKSTALMGKYRSVMGAGERFKSPAHTVYSAHMCYNKNFNCNSQISLGAVLGTKRQD